MADIDYEALFKQALESINDDVLREEVRKEGSSVASFQQEVLIESSEEEKKNEAQAEKSQAIANSIREMSIPQRIKLALFGNLTARQLLIRDSNRVVAMFVLQNARITENEIVDIAKNTQLDDSILRAVGNNGSWMKSYATKLAVVSNPKVPIDVALKWLKFIQDKDLRRLAKSKNIPQVVASQARKLVDQREKSG